MALGIGALLVIFTLSLIASGQSGALRGEVDRLLSDSVLSIPPEAFACKRVWQTDDPFVIYVDEVDQSMGYQQSFNISTRFLTRSVRTLGQTAQTTLAYFLDVPAQDLHLTPEAAAVVEGLVLDVHVEAYAGLMPSVNADDSLAEMRAAAAAGLCKAYDLQATITESERDVRVLRAEGDLLVAAAQGSSRGRDRMTRGPGLYKGERLSWGQLQAECRQQLDYRFEQLPEGFDTRSRLDFELSWEPTDPAGFEHALAQTLGLSVVTERRLLQEVSVGRL